VLAVLAAILVAAACSQRETVLTQATVADGRFGQRIAYPLDGAEGAARAPLWQRSLLPAAAKPVSATDDVKCESISPEVGIIGAPVIDPAANTLYVVAKMHGQAGGVDRKYALDVGTGKDKLPPVTLSATVAGSNSGDGRVRFDAAFEQQRVGLLLQDGVVYAAFSSYCSRMPYEGWILGYRGSIFVTTGNGPYDLNQPGGRNAGMSLLRLVRAGGTLRVADAFTPFNVTCLNDHDQDLSSGAPLLLTGPGEVLEFSKDSLGGFHAVDAPCDHQDRTDVDQIVQELPSQTVAGGVWGAETTWTGGGKTFVYTAGVADKLTAWQLVDGRIVDPPASRAAEGLSYPIGIPVVSSDGDRPGTALVWIVGNEDGGPVLRAYDPTDLRLELAHEKLTGYTNFTVPTVAAGRVVVSTQRSVLIYGPL
jgi:hypothetical protein